MPEISIILPVYNAEPYLDRCISSVLRQSFSDWELLLVDDGSTDGSPLICRQYSESDIRIRYYRKSNGGVSSARNLGLEKSIGKYVMFLDSDDYMYDNMCSVMHSAIDEKNADCVVCGTHESDGSDWAPLTSVDYLSMADFLKDFSHYLKYELLSPPWNKIFRRNLIFHKFDESISFGEDLVFNLDYISSINSISFINEILHFHEKDNDGSLVKSCSLKRLFEIETVCERVKIFSHHFIKDDELYVKYSKDISYYTRCFLINSISDKAEKIEGLTNWHSHSHLKTLNVFKVNTNLSNIIKLFLLKSKQFSLLYHIYNR